jgi:hypothetical protein
MLLVLAEAFYTGKDRTALAGLAVAGGVARRSRRSRCTATSSRAAALPVGEMLVADRTGYALSALLSVTDRAGRAGRAGAHARPRLGHRRVLRHLAARRRRAC